MAGETTRDDFGDLQRRTIRGRTFIVVRRMLLGLCRLVIGMRVEGTPRVPAGGGLLVVANHLHNADPLLISIACPRPVHYMAKVELMSVPVIGPAIRLAGAFPVSRGRADRNAIRRALAAVNQGIAVGIFPEGTRSKNRQIEHVHPGVGLIAVQAGVPIVPVAITGTEHLPFGGSGPANATRRSWWIPFRRKVLIVMGDPITLPAQVDGRRLSSEAATDMMMRAIADLLPESYRGVYRSSSGSETSTPSSSYSSSSSNANVSGTTNAPSSS